MEIVEHEDGVEQGHMVVSESPFQMDAGPFDGRFALPHLADFAHGFHLFLQS
jgi:hypothetical protein